MKLDQLLEAINGKPGDSRNQGLSGAYIKVGEKLDTLSDTAKRMEAKLTVLEAKDVASRVQVLEYERDSLHEELADIHHALREAKQVPWPKLLLAMMAVCAGSMGLAVAVFAFLQKTSG